ncbi:hypothetical protein DAEQUDRAFT_238134 [Daedalea quercina L-15889]|uniref:Uncharacterized protein n=1 Tax=Daedalea quercina L-15889 TaxID=1314783 RepID=A0A165QXK0_9APHY|nr:hypothetical protein DAEQUDRAFT_238134 [Daedalea quercina L-15889]
MSTRTTMGCAPLVFGLVLLTLLVAPAKSAPTITTSIPQYFCYRDATIAWNLLIYLSINYILHAAAIPGGADIGRYTERVTRRDAYRWRMWLSLVSLFLPFFALARTIILIAEQLKCKENDVLAALHHGALLVVVRDSDWEPSLAGEIIYTRLPDGFDQEKQYIPDYGRETNAVISFDAMESKQAYYRVNTGDRLLHGVARPPSGYSLAVPAHKAYSEEVIRTSLDDTTELKIHHPPGITNVLLSIFQIIFASFTLYSTPSDQIPRWGYAAYGLSVFPYALMSVMNLLCAGLVGSYTCGQILRTPILQESLQREAMGTKYDGIIGSLKEGWQPQESDIGQKRGEYVAVRMRTVSATQSSPRQLVVTGDRWERTYCLLSEGQAMEATRAVVRFTVSALSHTGPPREQELKKVQAITWLEIVTIVSLFLIALIMPYALIYALTGFRPNGSTVSQRAWMMAWLAADQLSSCGTLIAWAVWKRFHDIIPTNVQYACVIALMVPGVGGFVTVGRMFLADYHFGPSACTS